MASFYRAITAVCLVTFSGLQSAAGSDKTYKWTAKDVTADAYLPVNLARNGRLAVHISEVAKDEQLAASLAETVTGSKAARTGTTCQELIQSKAELKDLFYSVLDTQKEPDYSQLLQASLDAGLALFKNNEYPQTKEEWERIWGEEAGANLAYLLSSNSTTVGCILGKCTEVQSEPAGPQGGETGGGPQMAVLICGLRPAATKNQAPFDEEYFAGLIARKAKIAEMTADDLKATTNDGTAAAAVPTILIAGLIAILAVVSA